MVSPPQEPLDPFQQQPLNAPAVQDDFGQTRKQLLWLCEIGERQTGKVFLLPEDASHPRSPWLPLKDDTVTALAEGFARALIVSEWAADPHLREQASALVTSIRVHCQSMHAAGFLGDDLRVGRVYEDMAPFTPQTVAAYYERYQLPGPTAKVTDAQQEPFAEKPAPQPKR